MKCQNCGAAVRPDQLRCLYCGSHLDDRQARPQAEQRPQTVVYNIYHQEAPVYYAAAFPGVSDKSRWVAFFLCWFLGGVGAHKFYLGKTGMGFLYLFTGGLFGIGWFIDFFSLLFGRAKDSQGRRLA